MAHLVRQKKTYYADPAGKRVPKGTRGARKVTEKSSKWYGAGIPGLGKKRVPLATDKEAARRMLDDLVRGAERGEARLPDRNAGRKPLRDYLAQFEKDLALGLASRGGKRRRTPSPRQVALHMQRLRDLCAGCGFAAPGDLNADAPEKLARYLNGRLGRPCKRGEGEVEGGISDQTAAYFLALARRFARWMSGRAPVRADLFDGLPGFDPANNRRHARREISPEEMARLIETTQSSATVVHGLPGPDRAMLYLVAFATGYRAGELAELGPENFDLDVDIPVAVLPARFTKNNKPARQPLQPGLAAMLRLYLADKPRGRPVWPGPWSAAPVKLLRGDLAAAGVPYCLPTLDGPRYADFHALRHSYLSALAASGTGVKELQTLARHSDPRVTLGIYTHARQEALAAAVGRLELPGVGQGNPLAKLSRAELEAAVVALAAALNTFTDVVTPRVTPAAGSAGDGGGLVGTKRGRRTAG